jgi:hypothetical protein
MNSAMALTAAIDVFSVGLCAFAYRLRGGGFITTGHDWIVRLIWGLALTLAYFDVCYPWILWYLVTIIPTVYVSMLIPHAYCQNMGRWATPQKKWPSWFLRTLTTAEWTAMPAWARTAYDAMSMGSIGFLRAVLVFAPFALASHFTGGAWQVDRVLLAVGVRTVWQPLAYYFGWLVPFSLGSSLTAYSTEWCEFFDGAGYGVALLCL